MISEKHFAIDSCPLLGDQTVKDPGHGLYQNSGQFEIKTFKHNSLDGMDKVIDHYLECLEVLLLLHKFNSAFKDVAE